MDDITLNDCFQFILKYRKNKVFRGFSEAQIKGALSQGLQTECIIVDVKDNKICGLALGIPFFTTYTMHVSHILCIEAGSMARILLRFMELWPGWNIEAERKGKLKKYKPSIFKKILSYG
jgi:hypothetical protein